MALTLAPPPDQRHAVRAAAERGYRGDCEVASSFTNGAWVRVGSVDAAAALDALEWVRETALASAAQPVDAGQVPALARLADRRLRTEAGWLAAGEPFRLYLTSGRTRVRWIVRPVTYLRMAACDGAA